MSDNAHKSWHIWSMLVLLLLLTALAAPLLKESIWIDERRTLNYAGAPPAYGPGPVSESLAKLAQNYWQSPGYFLFLWGWWRAMSADVFTMRLPSLYFGLLAVAGTFALGRRYFDTRVGMYAAALMSLSAFYVHFLHEMRTYTLLALAAVIVAWAYGWVVTERANWRPWGLIVLALGVGLALYTHFFVVFPLAALGIAHLIWGRGRASFWPVIGAAIVGGLMFSPWIPVFLGGVSRSTTDARLVDNMGAVRGIADTLHFFSNGNLVLALLLGGLAARNSDKVAARRLWFVVILSFALLWGATRFFQAFTEIKYVLYYWPALGILGALGLEKLRDHGIRPVWILALWGAAFAGSLLSEAEQARIHPWETPPLREVAHALDGLTADRDTLLWLPPPTTEGDVEISDSMLAYYMTGAPLLRSEVVDDVYATPDDVWAANVIRSAEGATRVLASYETDERTWRVGPLRETILPEIGFVD
ncbi:MAG: glycosyltransferase family 39 protein, partial [Chloroflexota bacterium]